VQLYVKYPESVHLSNGDTMALKRIGFHTSASGRRYELLYDPAGKIAQAVLPPKGGSAGHLVLAFRAESEEEARKMLIEELDSRSL
jgi:hypothetical protein